MRLRPKSLGTQVTLLLLLQSSLLTLLSAWLVWQLFQALRVSGQQQNLQESASELAPSFQPYLTPIVSPIDLRRFGEIVVAANPDLEIYLLSHSGEVLWSFARRGVLPAEKIVPLAAIKEFLRKNHPKSTTLLGPDPARTGRIAPFSAAEVRIEHSVGYLYIVLDSGASRSLLNFRLGQYSLPKLLGQIFVAGLCSALLGVLFSAQLRRRLRRLSSVVTAIQLRDYTQKADDSYEDEIGAFSRILDHMRETIQHQIVELESRDRIRRELVADIAHDLRGPLSSVKAHLELARTDPSEKENRTEALKRGFESLEELLNELLELSRLEAKERIPEKAAIEIFELFEELNLRYSALQEVHNCAIVFLSNRGETTIFADVSMILRALGNLIDNAIRHSGPGGRVCIEAVQMADKLRISVEDTGPGISAGDLKRVLSRFERASTNLNQHPGSFGLGLAIVTRILELHDTRLEVESDEGRGCRFSFILPVRDSARYLS